MAIRFAACNGVGIIVMQLNEHPALHRLSRQSFKEKRITSALRKCIKKLSAKSSADLSQLKALAYALYVHGYEGEALRRRLSFAWLSDAVIARYEKAGDKKTANNSRFSEYVKVLRNAG